MVRKLLIALAVFFVIGVIVLAIVRGVSALNIDIPFFGDDEQPTPSATPAPSSGSGSFLSSARDALLSPFELLSGTSTTSGTYFTPSFGEIKLSDSFEPEDYARYQEAWDQFDEADPTNTAAGSSSEDVYFDTSLYFGPTSLDEAKHYGDPSAWFRKVVFSEDGHSFGWYGEISPPQYLTIEAPRTTEAPVTITGWSLQSMKTGERLYIPAGVRILRTGEVAQLQQIALAPGERAIVAAFKSPVGASFKENICSGYLDQFQSFTPELPNQCPSAASELPVTPPNTETFGSTCYEYLSYVPRCEFQTDPMPEYLTANCANFIRETISYNGCVNTHVSDAGFLSPVWRVYLHASGAPWVSSDTIRLLDAEGRVVDILRI